MTLTAERAYYLKAYIGWWLCLAFFGSLFANDPSPTFWGAVWNPLVWNIAGLLAFAIATGQTCYRESIKGLLENKIFLRISSMLFWGWQFWQIAQRIQGGWLGNMFVFLLSVFYVALLGGLFATIHKESVSAKEQSNPDPTKA